MSRRSGSPVGRSGTTPEVPGFGRATACPARFRRLKPPSMTSVRRAHGQSAKGLSTSARQHRGRQLHRAVGASDLDTRPPWSRSSEQDLGGSPWPCAGKGSRDALVDPLGPGTGRAGAAHHSHAPPRRLAPGPKGDGTIMRRKAAARAGEQRRSSTPGNAATSGGIEPSRSSWGTAWPGSAIGAVRCTSKVQTSTTNSTAQSMAPASPRVVAWLIWRHFRDGGQQVKHMRTSTPKQALGLGGSAIAASSRPPPYDVVGPGRIQAAPATRSAPRGRSGRCAAE